MMSLTRESPQNLRIVGVYYIEGFNVIFAHDILPEIHMYMYVYKLMTSLNGIRSSLLKS